MAKFAAIASIVTSIIGSVASAVTSGAGALISGAGKLASGAVGLLSGGGSAGALGTLGASGYAPGAAALAGGAGLTSAAAGGFLSGAGPALLGGVVGAGIGGAKGGLQGALKGGALGLAGGYGAGQFASGFGGTVGSLGQKLAGGAKALYSGAGAAGSKTGFNLGTIGKNILTKAGPTIGAGLLTKAFGPKAPTAADFAGTNPVDSYKNIKTFVGDSSLQKATGSELNRMVTTPLNQLAGSFNFGNDMTIRKLNEAFDKQVQEVKRQAANSGQSVLNSSDIRTRIDEIEQHRATALAESQQELNNYAMTQAIQAKQSALTEALQQNQFDDDRAFELADLIGKREFLEAAIRQGNVEDFQSIMAEILQIGFGG
jgi:hypothetical protein